MKKWLFEPFTYVAGAKALLIGWALMLITTGIAITNHTHFDGAIDVHTNRITPLKYYFIEPPIAWGSVVLVFYLAGLFFSRSSIRWIDVAGTFAMARWPLIFVTLLYFLLPHINSLKEIGPSYITIVLISLIFVIWMIQLMWQAFRVSCNISGANGVIIFIAGLILAEGISYGIINFIYTII
ncbi:hypothetical protein [Chitinophaga vietnamensis]|uniref:hypothetical protein n=1 Tax=Chitinophaga vietnamensis TaxID=2593957 RepID=UPI00117899D0|nr:hypothetical protein [Chitinophaga vietnamensis]